MINCFFPWSPVPVNIATCGEPRVLRDIRRSNSHFFLVINLKTTVTETKFFATKNNQSIWVSGAVTWPLNVTTRQLQNTDWTLWCELLLFCCRFFFPDRLNSPLVFISVRPSLSLKDHLSRFLFFSKVAALELGCCLLSAGKSEINFYQTCRAKRTALVETFEN